MCYHAVLLVFPERPPCPALSKYQQSSCFTILWVYEYFCSTPSPSVLEIWVFFFFEFWDPVFSFGSVWVFSTYRTFNFLARFHFSVSYSASVKGTVANTVLFASVPCNASINKSCASHFFPVRVRILWLLAAVNCLSLPFTYRTLCGRASLFPPSLPCPFHFQLTQARFHFSVSYSASVKGTVANSMLSSWLHLRSVIAGMSMRDIAFSNGSNRSWMSGKVLKKYVRIVRLWLR